jgi:hypothetical protein
MNDSSVILKYLLLSIMFMDEPYHGLPCFAGKSDGFLKSCLNQILRNAPLPPIKFNGGSGSWNQTFVVTVI